MFPVKGKLSDNTVKLTLGLAVLAALTVLLALGALPSVAIGALAVMGTVALVAYILQVRQPTPDELYELVGDAITEKLEDAGDIMIVRDEEEE